MARKELRGIRVVLLRAQKQASPLEQKLRFLGAHVQVCPMIAFRPNPFLDSLQLEEDLKGVDNLVFCSANSVHYFFVFLKKTPFILRSLVRKKLFSMGPQTQKALWQLAGLHSLIPPRYCCEGLMQILPEKLVKTRWMLCTSNLTCNKLALHLRQRGSDVKICKLYQTYCPQTPSMQLIDEDCVFFTSPSTVKNFFSSGIYQNQEIRAFCIGPETLKALKVHSEIKNIICADSCTADAMIQSLLGYFRKPSFSFDRQIKKKH